MANEKISAMPTATLPLAGTELVPVVQGGANAQIPASDVLNQTGTIVSALTQITFNANGNTAPGADVSILGADVTAGTSAELDFITGNATGAGVVSGPMFIGSGNAAAGNSGLVSVGSGTSGSGTTGNADFFSGNTTGSANSGHAGVSSGDTTAGTGNSGNAFLGSSDAGGTAGDTNIFTGTSSGNNADGGDINLVCGSATAGNANGGDITLTAGNGVGSGRNGEIIFNSPTAGTGIPIAKVSTVATSDKQIGTIPASAMIFAVVLQETAGHAVTVTLGTASGGSQILGGTAVGSSGIVPVNGPNLLLQAWVANQGIFIHSAAWNSASITVTVWYAQ